MSITGLQDDDLLNAAQASLTPAAAAARHSTVAQVNRLFSNGKEQIRRALEPFGYYNALVQGEVKQTADGFDLEYRVSAGPPVLVRRSKVEVTGKGADSAAVKRALESFSPAPGTRFDHELYEQSKAAVESALASQGFVRAKAVRHRVEISRRDNTADIDLAWQSGTRMRFGPVNFPASAFKASFLRAYVPWSEGEYYSPDKLQSLQKKLVDADYFSTVIVQPDLSNEQAVEVPINVTLSPAKRSVYTASLFANTDVGLGASVGVKHRWLNDRGYKADTSIEYAQRLENIVLGFHVPRPAQDGRSWNFGARYRDENTASSISHTARATANETRQQNDYTLTQGLQLISGTFEIGEKQGSSTLLFAEATLSRKRADDSLLPHRGYSYRFGARITPAFWVSDTSFVQLTADTKWIFPWGQRQRLLLRDSLGLMAVRNFDQLPPELRFFAGGDQSVRGFDYEALGSTDDEGNVIGGQYLAVGSVELERQVLPKWSAAVFTDAGDAFLGSSFKLNLSAGIGIRWHSPVGLVRLDVAKPVVSDMAHDTRVHIVIGPDL